MDIKPGPTLYPLHRCKTIHLVRHAQGIHNVDGDKNYKAYMSQDYFDAQLTPLGWQQVDNLRKHVHESGLLKRIELVITSPLLRTMQTAVGVFGGGGYADRMDILPLMTANAGDSFRGAISSLDSPPFLAVESCREHLVSDLNPANIAMLIHIYDFYVCLKLFGISFRVFIRVIDGETSVITIISFLQIESDEDILWKADVRETTQEVAARGLEFLNWLWTRKEKEIAIVTHSGFLFHTLSALGNDYHPSMKQEISKHFANCELRSMVIVDRSMIGSDTSTTNYPGKNPSGLDDPSAAADKNHKQ